MKKITPKEKLDSHYISFDKSKLSPDPLEIPHKFCKNEDIELMAFIAALFAYGNVRSIINVLNYIVKKLGDSPYDTLLNSSSKKVYEIFGDIYYRFYSTDDVIVLFLTIKSLLKKYSSIEILFMLHYNENENTLKHSISSVMKMFLTEAEKINGKKTNGLKYMFPDPEKGSACKRINLFLRWMVRKDELDFGLWKGIPPSKLVIPVDTHIATISRKLGLTNKKNVSWNMAEEITENLRKFDNNDPVKYDFALCHIGIRKITF